MQHCIIPVHIDHLILIYLRISVHTFFHKSHYNDKLEHRADSWTGL